MKKTITIFLRVLRSFSVGVLFTFAFILINQYETFAQKIYKVKYEYQADLKVFIVDYEYQCDLKVYFVDYEYQANKDGLWFTVEYEYQTDKKLYFVDYEYQADLKIYIVDYEYQAGWRNNKKQHLLKF